MDGRDEQRSEGPFRRIVELDAVHECFVGQAHLFLKIAVVSVVELVDAVVDEILDVCVGVVDGSRSRLHLESFPVGAVGPCHAYIVTVVTSGASHKPKDFVVFGKIVHHLSEVVSRSLPMMN